MSDFAVLDLSIPGTTGAEPYTENMVVPIRGNESHLQRNSSATCSKPTFWATRASAATPKHPARRLRTTNVCGEQAPTTNLIDEVHEMFDENDSVVV